MANNAKVVKALAAAGSGVEERMRETVEQILSLVWDVRSDSFTFADNPDVDAEVNRILAMMDDGMMEDAVKAAKALLKSIEMGDWEDDAVEFAERGISNETPLFWMDMQATHLKELLQGWIVVAAVYGMTREMVWRNLRTFLGNPFAAKMWRGAGQQIPHWGKGYMSNLIDAYRRLIRDFISRAYRYAELRDFERDGATGYTIHRGSTFDCPVCDSYTGRVYPINEVILPIHVNCMCYTEPVYGGD